MKMGVRLGLLLGLLLLGTVAWAEECGLTPREQALLERIEKLEQRVAQLEKPPVSAEPVCAAPTEATSCKTPPEATAPAKKDGTDLRVFWKEGLRMESEDKAFTMSVGGKIQNDWAFFNQDEELELTVGDVNDGTEFRRARLNVRGTIYDSIEYKAEYDFANDTGSAAFTDVYMGLKGLPAVGNLRIGHFKEPFNLDILTSDSYTMFMEPALPTAFAPSRNLGLMLFDTLLDKRMTWAVGVFKNVDNFPSLNDADEDQGYAVTARLTGLPWYADEGRKLLHLGASYSHRNPDGAVLGYSTRPEAHLAPPFVNTERFEGFRFLDARMDNVDLWDVEGLLILGPLTVQSEYTLSDVDTTFSGNHDLDGFYVQAGYLLTGETRSYDLAAGTPGKVKPKHNFGMKDPCGWGAWEAAIRYSTIDLNSGNIRGGQEDDWTAGINWYLNTNTKVMLNYVWADIEHDLYEGDLDTLQLRFQVDF